MAINRGFGPLQSVSSIVRLALKSAALIVNAVARAFFPGPVDALKETNAELQAAGPTGEANTIKHALVAAPQPVRSTVWFDKLIEPAIADDAKNPNDEATAITATIFFPILTI